jgi:hypothetical protein
MARRSSIREASRPFLGAAAPLPLLLIDMVEASRALLLGWAGGGWTGGGWAGVKKRGGAGRVKKEEGEEEAERFTTTGAMGIGDAGPASRFMGSGRLGLVCGGRLGRLSTRMRRSKWVGCRGRLWSESGGWSEGGGDWLTRL